MRSPQCAGLRRLLPRARAGFERVEEVREADVVIRKSVLPGHTHARVVDRAHRIRDGLNPRLDRRTELLELLLQLGAQTQRAEALEVCRLIILGERAQVTMQPSKDTRAPVRRARASSLSGG